MRNDLTFRIGAELGGIKGALASLKKDFGSVTTAMKALLAGFVALQGVQTLGQLVRQGVEFNAAMEDARLGIASIIASMAKLRDAQGQISEGPEALNIALDLADDQMRKLRIAGLETAASTRELAAAFQQAIGPGLSAGLNLDQIRDLTVQITQAATALGVPTNQLSQEIRAILSGEIDMNARVARTLGLTNEMVKNWQRQGTLVQELSKRMAGFSDAGKAAAGNFSVIVSNAKESVDTLGGEVFQGFFERLKKGIADSTAGLFDTKNLAVSADLREAVELAQELATALGEGVADTLRGIVELAKDFSGWVGENRKEIDNITDSAGMVWREFLKLVNAAAEMVGLVSDAGVKMGVFSTVTQAVGILVAGVRDGFRAIGAAVVYIGANVGSALLQPFEAFFRLMAAGAAAIGKDDLAGRLRRVADGMVSIGRGGSDLASSIVQPLLDGRGAVASYAAELAKLQQRQAALANSNRDEDRAELARLKARAEILKAQSTVAGLRNPPSPDLKEAQNLAKAQLDADEKLQKDASKRALEILKERFDDAKIATAAYYAERQRIELEAIDREIAIENKRAKAGGVDSIKALAEIDLLERQKNDVRRKAQREEAADRNALDNQVADAQIQLLEQQGRTADAAALKLDTRFADLRKRLVEDGNTAGVELIDKLINAGKAKANFDEIKTEFDAVIEDLRRRQQELADAVATGSISGETASEEQSAARQRAMAELDAINAKLQALAANSTNPDIKRGAAESAEALRRLGIDGAEGLEKAIISLRSSYAQLQKDFAQSSVNAGVDALTNLFTDLASGAKSAKEALNDFVRGFVQSMAQIAARALAMYVMLQVLQAVPGGATIIAALDMSARVSKHHTGGIVGGIGSGSMKLPAFAFAGAPRYHDGGLVGLKPDEVPAVLKRGEEVLTRDDPRHVANRGADSGRVIRNIIVFSEAELANALANSSGEKVVLNHVRRNKTAINNY